MRNVLGRYDKMVNLAQCTEYSVLFTKLNLGKKKYARGDESYSVFGYPMITG